MSRGSARHAPRALVQPAEGDGPGRRAAGGGGDLDGLVEEGGGASGGSGWGARAQGLARAATVPFLFLQVPQVLKNAVCLATARAVALRGLSPDAYLTAFLGNCMLLCYFAHQGENSGFLVQVVGLLSNAAILAQLFAAGILPLGTLAAVALTAAAVLGLGTAQNPNLLPRFSLRIPPGYWNAGQLALCAYACTTLYQVLLRTFALAAAPPLALKAAWVAGAVAGLGWTTWGSPAEVHGRVARATGWLATTLFIMMPIAQLGKSFADLATIQDVAVTSVVLSMLGNMLCWPQALLNADWPWITGTVWAVASGLCMLFLMQRWYGLGPPGAWGALGPPAAFGLAAAGVLVFFGWTVRGQRRFGRG